MNRKEYDAQRYQVKKTLRRQQIIDQKLRTKAWMDELKTCTPCADCAQHYHPVCMEWDHLPGSNKIQAVANLVAKGYRKQAEAEIEKCELVCANCHRLRTLGRAGLVKGQSEVQILSS